MEKTLSVGQVEGFCEINESNVVGLIAAFILQLAKGENHVNRGPVSAESALRLGVDKFSQFLLCPGKGLDDDVEEKDACVVGA